MATLRPVVTNNPEPSVTVAGGQTPRVTVTAPGPQGGRGPAGGSGGVAGGVDVTAYGATGDGVTDDTAAIQDALDDGDVGATVLFPPGEYLISVPLVVAKQQRLVGTHQTRYDPTEAPTSPCAIVCDPTTWVGTEAITVPPTAFGAHLDNLCLTGPGVGFAGTVHGIDTGAHADVIGESSLHLSGSTVSGFPGAAVHGHLWVLRVTDDCNLSANGWGVLVDDDNAILDARIDGADLAYNLHGGIVIDSTRGSGQVDLTNVRVERSGQTYGDPSTPAAITSHGIQIRSASFVRLSHVSTDANTGSGLDITPGVGQYVYDVVVRSCAFKRDGGGDQSYTTVGGYDVVDNGQAGVNIVGADFVSFDSEIGYGAADDGGGGPISPQYGLHLEDTLAQYVGPGRIEVVPYANSLTLAGTNPNLSADNAPLGLRTVPAIADETFMPTLEIPGMVVYRVDLGLLLVQRYGGTWSRLIGYDGVNPPRLPKVADLVGLASESKALRMVSYDGGAGDYAVRAVVAVSADGPYAALSIDRHDEAGDYLGSIGYSLGSGLLSTEHQYVVPPAATDVGIVVRGRTGQTAPLQQWEDVTATAVAGVTATGRMFAQPATAPDELIPLAQLQSIVAASSTWADFQTAIAAL